MGGGSSPFAPRRLERVEVSPDVATPEVEVELPPVRVARLELEGMREGDKRTLIIPSAMGYGKKGIKGVIPGGSALHFNVELVKVF